MLFCIRHDIYPARGRKHSNVPTTPLTIALFATIFTPQGDGNGIPTGEGSKQASDAIRHDIYPARGRKPVTDTLSMVGKIGIRHDIYPARGRKLGS